MNVQTYDPSAPAPLGVIAGMPDDVYHADTGLSSSRMGLLARSPAHLRATLDAPASPSTDAQKLGSAIHLAALQPSLFAGRILRAPEINRRTNAGKEKWAGLVERYGEDRILKPDQHDVCQAVAKSVRAHPTAGSLLAQPEALVELSIFWEVAGVRCKARIDFYDPETRTLADLKSTRDACSSAFQKALYDFGYYRQLAWYGAALAHHGAEVEQHLVIAAEKEPPYAVAVYQLAGSALEAGIRECYVLGERYRECLEIEAGEPWPAYSDDPEMLDLPAWAYGRITRS